MTRTQFLASICAIPFIGKLFKHKEPFSYCEPYIFKVQPKKRWMQITIPYTGNDKVLGYPNIYPCYSSDEEQPPMKHIQDVKHHIMLDSPLQAPFSLDKSS